MVWIVSSLCTVCSVGWVCKTSQVIIQIFIPSFKFETMIFRAITTLHYIHTFCSDTFSCFELYIEKKQKQTNNFSDSDNEVPFSSYQRPGKPEPGPNCNEKPSKAAYLAKYVENWDAQLKGDTKTGQSLTGCSNQQETASTEYHYGETGRQQKDNLL